MTSIPDEVTAKFVPAAAVIRMWQALFGITGHKAHVGGAVSGFVKSPGLTGELQSKLLCLSTEGESGTLGVAVECEDIQGKAGSESGSLVRY